MMNESSDIWFTANTTWLTTNPTYTHKHSTPQPHGSSDATKLAFVALLVAFIHYQATAAFYFLVSKQEKLAKLPPLVPHSIPIVGTIPWGYLWNALNYVTASKYIFHSSHPVRVLLFGQEFYILQGAKNISTLFKQGSLSAFAVHGSLLRYVFSLPKSAAQTYYNDDSGEHEKPHEDSSVESHNRVDFLTRSSFVKFLTGPGLAPLSARFEHNISEGLNCLAPSQSWIPITDLMDVFQHHVSGAVIDAMCGHFLLKQHPTFLSDFWKIDHNIMTLFTRTPQFMARNAYRSRDRALDAVKAWHAWAKDNFDPAAIGPDGDDPYWGTKFFRERQDMFLNMTGFNADAVASQELAFIWGANTNAIISAFWVTLEVFKDPEILATIRDEVEDCIKPDVTGQVAFDLPKLLKKPFLQAVLSETLRLRVNGFLVRRPMRESLKIHEWTIPKDRFCLTSSTPGHMDPNVWCQGANAAHAVTDFWPGRFLKPNKSTGQMEFSLKGTEGSWMPFGGGIHMCPGKVFAKHVICLSVATMVTRYDCIVTAKVKDMEMSTRNFGFGTSAPVGKVPVLMRRRDAR